MLFSLDTMSISLCLGLRTWFNSTRKKGQTSILKFCRPSIRCALGILFFFSFYLLNKTKVENINNKNISFNENGLKCQSHILRWRKKAIISKQLKTVFVSVSQTLCLWYYFWRGSNVLSQKAWLSTKCCRMRHIMKYSKLKFWNVHMAVAVLLVHLFTKSLKFERNKFEVSFTLLCLNILCKFRFQQYWACCFFNPDETI